MNSMMYRCNCGGHAERIRRRGLWQRLLPWTKRFYCPACDRSFLVGVPSIIPSIFKRRTQRR